MGTLSLFIPYSFLTYSLLKMSFTLADITKIEDEINNAVPTFVVINKHENIIDVMGIFTSYHGAKEFMSREIINTGIEGSEDIPDCTVKNLHELVQTYRYNVYGFGMEIIIVTHLDPERPIYKIVNKRDGTSRGKPYQYLTNDPDKANKFQNAREMSFDPDVNGINFS